MGHYFPGLVASENEVLSVVVQEWYMVVTVRQ